MVDADQAGNDLYPAAETESQTITVGKAPLVVVAPSPHVVYGIDPGSFDPTYETLVNGDTAPDTPATCAPAQSTYTAVGRYAIVCSGASDANYDISYEPGTLVVTRAPITVTAKPIASKYALASSRLTLSAAVKHATTGAVARGIPVTFTTRSAFGRTITCKNTTNLNGVATCTTGYAFYATPSAYNAVAAATHNYVGGSGTAAITFVGPDALSRRREASGLAA